MPPCKIRASKRAPTLRKMTSSSLSEDDVVAKNAAQVMATRSESMDSRAKDRLPFTSEELQDVMNSLHNISPKDLNVDWKALERLLGEVAHLSHKDWHVTGTNSDKMADILLPREDGLMSPQSHQMFERILHEGNWDCALEHAKSMTAKYDEGKEPCWAVLVTGVNGIRKTTSIYQPWFSNVLQEALIAPSSLEATKDFALGDLPNGDNSFFRQLDHMITTLCNEDFSALYALTGAQLQEKESKEEAADDNEDPPKELIKQYSNLKASIFSRYRTLSELLGVLLLKEAQKYNINTMCETSGRDIAMFHYIDHFFPLGKYNKLALHFTINDLSHAEQSVDARMVREMTMGKEALGSGDVVEVIYANTGGPYGSEVLEGVQADSDRVWNEVVMKKNDGGDVGFGKDWYKAEMRITAHEGKPWTIQAVRPD
eukprot:CAMPEP_0183733414 /NCGR_PEP_ID=MMETSP0737-20130205/41085_1 /TAXON_ID=385413 /ORGANISM="Thalassiosira miniscula, Strain CCMP1093" /LENGTH=427 /DNA_ID=CAMNT_0025966663 /DNA_START=166 /DNA_END=1446 /DNA_ORIENTATION=-